MQHKKYTPYVGAVLGGIVGAVLPAYISWEIGDWAQKYLELTNPIMTTLKITSSAVLVALTYNATVPIGVFTGMVTEKILKDTSSRLRVTLEDLIKFDK